MLVILVTNVPDFIEPSNWLSNSHDLNLVDYSIRDALQQLLYRQKFKKHRPSETNPEQLLEID